MPELFDGLMVVGLVGIVMWSWVFDRGLRRNGATAFTRLVALGLLATMIGVVVAVRAGAVPGYAGLAAGGLWASAMTFPDLFLRLTGGRHLIVRLRWATSRIQTFAIAVTKDPQRSGTPAELDGQLAALQRFRTPATAEYIELFERHIRHLVESTVWPGGGREMARMQELERAFQQELDRLDVGSDVATWTSGPVDPH